MGIIAMEITQSIGLVGVNSLGVLGRGQGTEASETLDSGNGILTMG